MERNKKLKYKIYIAIASFFILLIAGFAFLIFPIIRGIVYNSDEIQKKRIDNEINKQGISKIPEMEKLNVILEEKKDNFKVIIDNGGEVEFFKKIESLAIETGNRIEFEINSEKDTQKRKVTKAEGVEIINSLPYENYVIMTITLLGDYENLIKFLNKLEKNDKYVNVVGLDISKMEVVEESISVFSSDKNNESKTENTKKEILQSIINLVVYVKK